MLSGRLVPQKFRNEIDNNRLTFDVVSVAIWVRLQRNGSPGCLGCWISRDSFADLLVCSEDLVDNVDDARIGPEMDGFKVNFGFVDLNSICTGVDNKYSKYNLSRKISKWSEWLTRWRTACQGAGFLVGHHQLGLLEQVARRQLLSDKMMKKDSRA